VIDGTLLRRHQYVYDRAGNRTQEIITIGGTPTTTNYAYSPANQLTGDGIYTYEYDDNGNLRYKKQGQTTIDTYAWDRANRLLSVGNYSYKYDGEGHHTARQWLPCRRKCDPSG